MTLPKVARVFFAIDLPITTKDQVSHYIGQLKKSGKSRSIRWTRSENLHITLHFLAEVKGEHIPDLIKHVRNEIKDVAKDAQFSFNRIHLFPNPYRPRVIVLEVDVQDEIVKLAQMIGQGIVKTNYPIETRPFRPHLTLGRIKQPHGINLNFLNEVEIPHFPEITLNEVILFRSEPNEHGSKYTVLEKITW